MIVALIALLVSRYSWRTADRAARNDVIAQVRDWAGEVIDMLSAAGGLCALDPGRMPDGAFFLKRSELMSGISSLLDRGRMFFPNTYREKYGTEKLPAFQGIRPQILDLVLLSHELTRSIDYNSGLQNDRRRRAFVDLKKVFVSAVQQATSFDAPSTLIEYEKILSGTAVVPLPHEVRILANAKNRNFALRFDDKPLAFDDES